MTGALGTALAYIDRGWAPVPAQEQGPVIVRWQDLRISHETALRHFNSAAQNVGVILGPASGGLTDIDLDCPEVIGLASYFQRHARFVTIHSDRAEMAKKERD